MVPTSCVLSPICCSFFSCWLVDADQALLIVAQWLDVALVADLSGQLLAVLNVAVLLSFLGISLHLKLVDLLRLETIELFLSWEGKTIVELPAVPVNVRLALVFLGML